MTVNMPTMFTRALALPARSFFLLGPRGTGKTTWLRQQLPKALWYDLLEDRQLVRLLRDPSELRAEVEALPAGSWVVIDEVQRVPRLLDVVHQVLSGAARPKVSFALTGSSARKLRRQEVNLLAGRALLRTFFPLTASELEFRLAPSRVLETGLLPTMWTEDDPTVRAELLEAYRDTYLTQEIRAEAAVRSLEGFTRFLEVAALMNGQVVNVSSIARDAGVARQTVQSYFEVLTDSLLATWLPAFRPKARVRETAHPKLYCFDPGVARSLARRTRLPLESAERGPLLETWVLHELRAWLQRSGLGGELAYWRTPSGVEVDFIWSHGKRHVAIEVKASARWRPEDSRGLEALEGELGLDGAVGVYLGDRALKAGKVEVLPVLEFARRLGAGEVL